MDGREQFTPEEKARWDAQLAAINYTFMTEPKVPNEEIYGVEVMGVKGTDREGELFHYRFQEGETLDHLMQRVMWERSWDGYSSLEDYLAANPMP